MKVALIGANGQLGSDLQKVLVKRENTDFLPLTHQDLEICDYAAVQSFVTQAKPDVIINTAAFHKVDLCEDEITRTFEVNTYAIRNLAQVAAQANITLVQLSTDYVFSGKANTPYTEQSAPEPINVYGTSKLAGEYFIRSICPKYFIVRSTGLYGKAGSSGKGGNFVELMLRLAHEGKDIRVVSDQTLTPTYTVELARKIVELINTEYYGLYHITNGESCSWYEFAQKIFELSNLSPSLTPTTSIAFGAKAQRPVYSVLAHNALKVVNMDDLRSWDEALAEYLKQRTMN